MRDQIVALIRERPRQFMEIRAHFWNEVDFRVIDRELQKLRRAGTISYDRAKRVWRPASPQEQADDGR